MSNAINFFPSPPVGEGQGGGCAKGTIISNARNLRKNLTEVEKVLWYWLRKKNISGARFRKQAPIGNYIADFACHNPKLIIELDGGGHALQQNYDKKRDDWLRKEGFYILRFWNNEITENIENVLEIIYNQINILKNPPSPTLPHKVGRE